MDIVLLLGAGIEPAQSIARRVVGMGARVYGFANKFPEQGFVHRDFVHVGVNPADPSAILAEVEKIIAKEGAVTGIILAGHPPIDDDFESAHPNDIALTVFAGLAGPLAAVRAATPGLIRRRGFVLALTRPATGPGAALAGLVEAGLAAFCDGLFAETRDTGLRVCHVRLQENGGRTDPASRYTTAPQSRIQPDIVADAVESVMRLRENNAITRLVLRPQATREEPRIPVTSEPKLASLQMVQLPTWKNYPPAEEKIFTPEYRRPDYAPAPEPRDNDFDDDDDESVDPELAYLIKPRHRDRFVRDNTPRDTPSHEPRVEFNVPAPSAPAASLEEKPATPTPTTAPQPAAAQEPVVNVYVEAPRTSPTSTAQPQRSQQQQPNEPRQFRDQRDPRPQQQQPRDPRAQDMYPQHKDPNQRNRPGDEKQYYDPYAPQQPRRKEQRPTRNGSMRMNVPNTAGQEPQRRQEPNPNRPLRFEQMPRPRNWQGPRFPQNGQKGESNQQQQQQPQQHQPARDNRPQERKHAPAHEPRIFTDDRGVPVGGIPSTRPEPRPVPVIVPVESGGHSENKEPQGRSEAVTLDFNKPKPAVDTPVVAAEALPETIKKPVREKIVKAQRDEEIDEAPVRLKKRPATKKTAAKTDKALGKVEETLADDPEEAGAEAEPIKKTRKAPAKKKAE